MIWQIRIVDSLAGVPTLFFAWYWNVRSANWTGAVLSPIWRSAAHRAANRQFKPAVDFWLRPARGPGLARPTRTASPRRPIAVAEWRPKDRISFNASGPPRRRSRHDLAATSVQPILHRPEAGAAICPVSRRILCVCHPIANSRPSKRIRGQAISRLHPLFWEAGGPSSRTRQPARLLRPRRVSLTSRWSLGTLSLAS